MKASQGFCKADPRAGSATVLFCSAASLAPGRVANASFGHGLISANGAAAAVQLGQTRHFSIAAKESKKEREGGKVWWEDGINFRCGQCRATPGDTPCLAVNQPPPLRELDADQRRLARAGASIAASAANGASLCWSTPRKSQPSGSSSVSVYLGSTIWCADALFRSKVDEFVPQTQLVNLRKVGQAE